MAEEKTAEAKAPAKDGVAQKRILLVDDDHEIVESMRMALEAKGYQILVARDGNQGLCSPSGKTPIF